MSAEQASDSPRQMILLAVQASGGMHQGESYETYMSRVDQLALGLYVKIASSPLTARIAELNQCTTFDGTLLKVEIEERTTRAILTLRTWSAEDGDNHQETIRTDRTDDPKGLETYEAAKRLVGRRVRVFKAMEEPRTSAEKAVAKQGYRCAKYLMDLGPDTRPTDRQQPASAPRSRQTAGADDQRQSTASAAANRPVSAPPQDQAASSQPRSAVPQHAEPPVDFETARHQIWGAVPKTDGPDFRQAAYRAVMAEAKRDEAGNITNLTLLIRLATAATKDSTMGQKIMAQFAAPASEPAAV